MSEFIQEFETVSEDDVAEWNWKHLTIPQLERNGVEPMYQVKIEEWTNNEQRDVFVEASEVCRGVGAVVALVGKRGCGKTTIATQMIARRAEKAIEAKSLIPWMPYRKLQHLTGRLKGLYGDFGSIGAESLESSRDALCRAALLVIDEIHECEDMKLAQRILTDIIDIRYSRRKDTVLISNHSPKEFQSGTNDSILSRLSHFGLIIPCNWKSFRTPNP